MSEESPCVGICVLRDDICIGCGRSSAEIFAAGVAAGHDRGDEIDEEKVAEPSNREH